MDTETRYQLTRSLMTTLTFETNLGCCGITWSEAGVVSTHLPGSQQVATRPSADPAPGWVHEAATAMADLLSGTRVDLRFIRLDQAAVDPFARRVYAATREIPAGATASYGEIARATGEPAAARAVGAALGMNPFPILVPCHRVLAADGSLHGFSGPGGLSTKRRMLEIERAPGFAQAALFA